MCFLSCAIVFSGASIDAAAALTNGRYLTPTESRDIFGSEISGKYYNGSEYVDCTFTYNTTATLYGVNTAGLTGDYLNANSTYLIYTAQFTANTAVQYITVEVQPTYSIFDTTQIHSCIALSAGTSNASSPATPSSTFQSPSWDWIIGGSSVHLENSDTISGGGKKAGIDFKLNSVHTWFSFVQLDFTSQSSISGYSLAADFYGNSAVGGKYYLAIGCPYVDSSSTASNGTFTTAPAGVSGDINVNVDVDMTETNGLLGTIADLLSGLLDGIQGLFVPSQNFVINWKDQLVQLLWDTFGPYDFLHTELLDLITDIMGEGTIQAVEFPAINVPHTSFTLPARSVPLIPNGTEGLFDKAAYAIDIVATFAVINMFMRKVKAVLVGEKVVEIDDAD